MTVTDLIPWRRRKRSLAVRQDRPWDDWMTAFQREMDQLMDRFARTWDVGPWGWPEVWSTGDFVPRVDISENDQAIKITAELPGLEEKDIDLTLTQDSLTIEGHKEQEHHEKSGDITRQECHYGHFRRVIPLTAEVDPDHVEATFKKGILKVTLPKTEAAKQQRKRIAVKTA